MKNKKQRPTLAILAMIMLAIGIFAFWQKDLPGSVENISYSTLVQKLDENQLQDVTIQQSDDTFTVKGKYKDSDKSFKTTISTQDKTIFETFYNKAKEKNIGNLEIKPADKTNAIISIIGNVVPFIIMIGLLFFFMSQMQGGGGGKIMNFQKSKAKKSRW